jgi:hypothetical protein
MNIRKFTKADVDSYHIKQGYQKEGSVFEATSKKE